MSHLNSNTGKKNNASTGNNSNTGNNGSTRNNTGTKGNIEKGNGNSVINNKIATDSTSNYVSGDSASSSANHRFDENS